MRKTNKKTRTSEKINLGELKAYVIWCFMTFSFFMDFADFIKIDRINR